MNTECQPSLLCAVWESLGRVSSWWGRPSHRQLWPGSPRMVTKGEVWLSRAARPWWWPRLLRGWIRREWLWRRQGRPTDVPVVLRRGVLLTTGGRPCGMNGWHFDFGKQTDGPIPVDYLWHWLAVRYPASVFTIGSIR